MRKKTPEEPRESNLASGWTIEASQPEPEEAAGAGSNAPAEPGADDVGAADGAGDGEGALEAAPAAAQLPNAALVFLGVLGGLYLLYSWIWLSWAQFYAGLNAQISGSAGWLGGALQQFVFWLAPLAPILWFFAALLLNRGSLRKTVLWILIGAVVLLPLPMFSGLGA